MRRFLVVANRTLGGEHLTAKVKECLEAGPCTFHVVVPVYHPPDHVWTEGEVEATARRRLEQALERFRSVGVDATGEVGDANPVTAVGEVLGRQPFDEIILSTLPAGPSRWLKQDVPSRVRRSFDLPVTHLIGREETESASA